MNQFPKALKAPTYEIEGVLHKRIPAIDAMKNPEAIRAALPISKGPDKGGEKIVWFVKV